MARAALVTAPPGIGKSRLRHELVARVRRSHDATVLIARADPVTAGSPLGLARQLIRAAAGTREAAPAHEQRAAIAAHLAPLLDEPERSRTADFLAELASVPAEGTPPPHLLAARGDPRIMAEWLRRSFASWIAALCGVRPVLVVLEDLHWGDVASVGCVSAALQAAADAPLMVLALARPEVHDVFPRLFEGASEQRLHLSALTRRAAERLARSALGDAVPADLVASIVARAEGNAYYLEELVRQVADRRSEGLPETLLAMAEARIARLDAEARRILRAASIFGGVFWSGGLAALLGGDLETRDLGAWLDALVDDEVLVRAARDRFADQREYAFRHGLSREAAYAMLTDGDRRTGHRLAAAWLESVGERDARALADHYERGGEPLRAAACFAAAAHAAVFASDAVGAIELARRGLACEPEAAVRGALLLQASRAHAFLGDMQASLAQARAALEVLEPGTRDWLEATANLVVASMHLGDPSGIAEVLQLMMSLSSPPAPSSAYGFVAFSLIMSLLNVGQQDLGLAVHERVVAAGAPAAATDPTFAGYLAISHLLVDVLVRGDLGGALRRSREALAHMGGVGDSLAAFASRQYAGWVLIELGDFAGAIEMEAPLLTASGGAMKLAHEWGTVWTGKALTLLGRPAEAIALLAPLAATASPAVASSARAMLAESHLVAGSIDHAAHEARRVLDEAMLRSARSIASSVLARIELEAGRPREALALADAGLALFADSRAARLELSVLHLARIDALRALGDAPATAAAVDAARARVERIAATIDDARLRRTYETVPSHARTLALAATT
jgi:tetratricopeptide (TPR) repeat protein